MNKLIAITLCFLSVSVSIGQDKKFNYWSEEDSIFLFFSESTVDTFLVQGEMLIGKIGNVSTLVKTLPKFKRTCGTLSAYISANLKYPFSTQEISVPIRLGALVNGAGELSDIGVVGSSVDNSYAVYVKPAMDLLLKMNVDQCWKPKKSEYHYIELTIRFKAGGSSQL